MDVSRRRRRRDSRDRPDEHPGDELELILFFHDPVGIASVHSREYNPEARTIQPRLRSMLSVDEITTIIQEEFARWFSPRIASRRDRYRSIAQDIGDACQRVGPR